MSLSLSARLLHIERMPPRSENEAQEVRGKCVLWMQPLLRDNEDNLLIRVECPLTMERHMYERKRVLLGHLLHWEGLRPTHAPTQSSRVVGSGTQRETDEAAFEQRVEVPDALAIHVSSEATVFHFAPFDPYGETERNHGSKYETATHYRLARGHTHQQSQQSSEPLQEEVEASIIVKHILNLSRLTAILHSKSIFIPPTGSDPAQAVSEIRGAALGCVQISAVVSHVRAIKDSGIVVDMTGAGVATDACQPSLGHKKDAAGTKINQPIVKVEAVMCLEWTIKTIATVVAHGCLLCPVLFLVSVGVL